MIDHVKYTEGRELNFILMNIKLIFCLNKYSAIRNRDFTLIIWLKLIPFDTLKVRDLKSFATLQIITICTSIIINLHMQNSLFVYS